MRVSDLIVEVRDSSLARVGQLLPKDLEGFTAVLRFNAPGTWTLTLPADHVLVDALRSPGAGLLVNGPDFSFSGPTREAKRSQSTEDPAGTWTISGVTDDSIFGERLAYPTPTTADVTAQTSDYDVRSGTASTLLYEFVDANLGPSAPVGRKVDGLLLADDDNLGSEITASARFENLGKLLTRLAAIDGLGFALTQDGNNLVFSVFEPTDRSAYVRFDIDNKLLTKSEYTYTAPTATRAIVAGQGAGVDRTFVEVVTDDSTTAETVWSRRIEVFKDSRSTADSAELAQVGTEELVDKGKTLEAVSVSPSDDVTMAFGTDWFLGDKVSVVVGEESIVQIVTEVGFKISEDGVRVGATVGLPSVADAESTVVETQENQEARISNLERNESESAGGGGSSNGLPSAGLEGQILAKASDDDYDATWIDNFSEQVKHEVKLGATISKGVPVYVSSANGTNMIVSKASNASEATSSKTIGLLETGGATNDFVKVVTEGLLAGLDTSAASAGDPVWLGVNGALLYGLANKPSAPAHMVYLGVVTRAQSNNGEIFVHIQNGFEIDELHNVAISSLADNNLLAYDSASSLWKNQTAAQAGLATSSHSHAIADVTGLQTALDSKVDESSETVTSGIVSNATGWGSSGATYLEKNGVVQINLRATRTGASLSSGNITNVLVQTISSGYRPALETLAGGGPTGPVIGAYINTSGGVYLTALGSGISTGDSIDINATYIKA
jgi:hypothetical protein